MFLDQAACRTLYWCCFCWSFLNTLNVDQVMATQGQPSSAWWMAISEAYSVPADKRPDLPDAGFSNFPFHCKLKENMAMPERAACLQRDHALWKTLQQGRDEAVTQCGNVMKDTPWSCPSNRNTSRIFGRAVLRGTTRESAFLHSLMTASVMRSIARACGQGLLADRCPCGQFEDTGFKGNIDWQWGNCSVNLVYGRNLVRKISNPLNARRQNQLSPRSVLQILNNAAGELALESVQRIKCRCHGVSSTCALKTCFMSSPNLHTTAQTLARKYRQAKEANVVRGSADRRPLLHLAKAIKQGKPLNFTEYQLHFTDSSPNFCKPDLIDGLPGSKGRPCSIRPGSHNSCAQRCCGEEPAVREERFRRCCRYKLTIGGGSIGRKCVRPCITVVRHYSCR